MNAPATDGSPFDKIRRFRPDGSEYWSARELKPYLGYAKWERMEDLIERAQVSCANQGHNPDDHFGILPGAGKNSNSVGRPGLDVHMTRIGCYLTAMNGDVRKPEIAAAQGYFAAMTRVAEVAGQRPTSPVAVEVDPIIALHTSLLAMRRAQLAGEARVD